MPRQRVPLEVAYASGAYEKNPGRFQDRMSAARPDPELGPAPMHFTPEQIDLWEELVGRVAPGVLTAADRFLVETAVMLLAKLRDGSITGVQIGHFRACLGSMGCTPADRTRVTGSDEPSPQEDPLAVIFGGNGAGHPGPN